MNDEQLLEALAELNRRLATATAADPQRTGDCLTFFRARAVVLDPARESPAEQAHLVTCRRCRQLVASFARQLPHLSTWTLIRLQMGALLPAEETAVEYHLRAGRCRECAARAARLARSPLALLQIPIPATLPHPAVARAAVPESEVLVRGENGDLEADLVRDGAELCLEVRTRTADYWQQLVAYVFESATGEALLEGYLVLGADVEGWYAAQAMLDPERFREGVSGANPSLRLAVVQPACLNGEEWDQVRASAPAPQAEARVKADWLAFCRQTRGDAGALSTAAEEALRAISSRIAGGARLPEAGEHVQPD